MTAFSRIQVDAEQACFTWELKSVNHRYLEMHFKLPDKLKHLEIPLRDNLRQKMARGKLDIHLHLKKNEHDHDVIVDHDKVASLMSIVSEVNAATGLNASPNIQQLLQWPGLLVQTETDDEELTEPLMAAFNKAIDALLDSRATEGDKLAGLIIDRLNQIDELVVQVKERMPTILYEHRKRIEKRLEELKVEIDEDRLTQEIVLLAQKIDVAEELDRLQAHVNEVRRTLSVAEPCGRRLDFLMQELNREANTLASKSIVADTSRGAVDLKVLIEQMREQIQNIE